MNLKAVKEPAFNSEENEEEFKALPTLLIKEPDSNIETNEADFKSLRTLSPNNSHLRGQQVGDSGNICSEKFWAGQWLCLSKSLPRFNMQSCDSALESDSFSSVSTRDSSLSSWSEGSRNNEMHALHSPKLLSTQISSFSLLDSVANEKEWACLQSSAPTLLPSGADKQRRCASCKDGVVIEFTESSQRYCESDMDWSFDLGRDRFGPERAYQENYASKLANKADRLSRSASDKGYMGGGVRESEKRFCDGNMDYPFDLGCDRYGSPKTYPSKEVLVHSGGTSVVNACDGGTKASSLSQETQMSNFSQGDNLIWGEEIGEGHQGLDSTCRPHIKSDGNSFWEDTGHPRLDFANDLSWKCCTSETSNGMCRANFDGKINSDTGKVCYCGSYPPDPNHSKSACDAKGCRHSCVRFVENSLTAGQNVSCLKGHRKVDGTHIISKFAEINPVARNGLPSFLGNAAPRPAKYGVDKVSFNHKKSGYSVIAKDRLEACSMHGHLRFVEQGGSPCYSFFLDGSDEVLFARASRRKREENKENSGWTYSFHSKRDNVKAQGAFKRWPKKESLVSELIANMRVSSFCHGKPKSDADACVKESCFVLYASETKNEKDIKRVASEIKLRGQPLIPVLGNASSSQAGLVREGSQPGLPSADAKVGMVEAICLHNGNISRCNQAEAILEDSDFVELDKSKLKGALHQQAELAAIIISTSLKARNIDKRNERQGTEREPAGWGMKFLETSTQNVRGPRFMDRSFSDKSGTGNSRPSTTLDMLGVSDSLIDDFSSATVCRGSQVTLHNITDKNQGPPIISKLAKRMKTRNRRLMLDATVILPAGVHGLPDLVEADSSSAGGLYGATPLLERWMAGGDCDCGGWDMGCGLSVFKAETLNLSRRISNISLTRSDCINFLSGRGSFKLLTQGFEQKKVLVLEVLDAGLFLVSFQPLVSPLQAFAIAVALFHQQMIR